MAAERGENSGHLGSSTITQWTVRVRRIMEPAGYDVIAAASGPVATSALRTIKPGLVVLNVCMPEAGSGSLSSD
jgi:hypothetical protein